jgi:hypothetical protein
MRKKWKNSVAVYVTPSQQAILQAVAKLIVAIMGRGSGKTSAGGLFAYQNIYYMPRSKGFILGLTYKQILNNFLPPMIELWEKLGLREDVHFVIGKTPPPSFKRAYNRPKLYENVISFANGTCIVLISMDRKDVARGGSYDWGIFDEAVLLNKERHDKEIIPMMRGNEGRYPEHLHKRLLYLSSQAWLPSGNWVPNMRHLVDEEKPEGVFYIESTAAENAAVGGQAYIDRMKEALPIMTFNVEILNMLVEQVPDCFYESFSEANLYSDSYAYDFADRLLNFSTKDKDYDPAKMLAFSFDFGGSICCATVHQDDGKADRTINAFYRKRDLSTPQDKSLVTLLVDDLIAQYKGHGNLIEIWGDRNGNNRQANSAMTIYEEIMGMLRAAGFHCVLKVQPGELDMAHITKHYVVNRLLANVDKHVPKVLINQNTCKALIISIQTAPVTMDMKKDKRSESHKSGTPQEHATHLSDCFDNYYAKKYSGNFGTGTSSEAWF